MWYVYILECNDQTFYTGITTDLKRRVEEHNSSIYGAKYTGGRRPVKMVYSCKLPTKSEVQKEEYRIRKLTKKEKIKLRMEKLKNLSAQRLSFIPPLFLSWEPMIKRESLMQ